MFKRLEAWLRRIIAEELKKLLEVFANDLIKTQITAHVDTEILSIEKLTRTDADHWRADDSTKQLDHALRKVK